MDRKYKKKNLPIFLGGPMGPIHPVWALAAIHPRWGNRYLLVDDQTLQSPIQNGAELDLIPNFT